MQKLRLAVFNTQAPHRFFGGVERRILEVAKRLENQLDISVYSATKGGFNQTVQIDGLRVIPVSSTDKFFPIDNWFYNRTLYKMAKKINADLYEAHTVSGYGVLRSLRKRNVNKPFIETIHGVLADEYVQGRQAESLNLRAKLANLAMWQLARNERECARNSTLIVTVSEYSAEKIVQHYDVDKAKISVVPNGVDIERFKPNKNVDAAKEKIGVSGKQTVLFVGRLIPRKGLFFLLEAAKKILQKNSNAVFVIVGNGPLKEPLILEIERANLLKNFLFLGDVKDEMLPLIYNSADIFALPSIQEGQGIALLEAQASGKPVVAFNVSAVKEAVVDQKTGLLVQPNSQELAEAITSLLRNEGLRQTMGNHGRQFVTENFTWDICASRMLQVYRKAEDAAEN